VAETAIFQHYGMSPWEIEVIFDTLKRSFAVEEKQVQPDDPQYVSMIEIGFPVAYGEQFFRAFTMDNWFKIKGMIKDVKRRRGRKGVKTLIRFAGYGSEGVDLVFPLMTKGDRQYEMGIEKIEYLIDVVPVQLKMVPPKTEEIWYSYDEATFRWSPAVAKSDNVNYLYKNGEWKTK
jgi:hypothetical protein